MMMGSAMRFFQTSALVLSTTLMGVACNSTTETSGAPAPASLPTIDYAHQWDSLIAGGKGLPSDAVRALRSGAREEALASHPKTALEENVPPTVSRARHERAALGFYQTALSQLDEDDPQEVRGRVRGKIEILNLSLQSLDGLNGRLFPAD